MSRLARLWSRCGWRWKPAKKKKLPKRKNHLPMCLNSSSDSSPAKLMMSIARLLRNSIFSSAKDTRESASRKWINASFSSSWISWAAHVGRTQSLFTCGTFVQCSTSPSMKASRLFIRSGRSKFDSSKRRSAHCRWKNSDNCSISRWTILNGSISIYSCFNSCSAESISPIWWNWSE